MSEQEANTLYTRVVKDLSKTLHEPFHDTLEGACAAPSGTSSDHSLSSTALAAIAETFRNHSDRIDLSQLTKVRFWVQVFLSVKASNRKGIFKHSLGV